jgi:hypothetical protein
MIQEFYHEYRGFGRVPSRCLVKISSDNDKHLILFEDINEGTSVTNASEQIASEIVNKMSYDPDNCRFFETYAQYNYDTFDEILYRWTFDNHEFIAAKPNWIPGDKDIEKILIK